MLSCVGEVGVLPRPPSTRTSTRLMPRSWDHATPATGTLSPAFTCANDFGTSIREEVLIGAFAE